MRVLLIAHQDHLGVSADLRLHLPATAFNVDTEQRRMPRHL
jgi:hypothetical protein